MALTKTRVVGKETARDKVGGSAKRVVPGLVLLLLGTALLWWNEGRTFKTAGAIGEARMLAQKVDVTNFDGGLDGKVIYSVARAETEDVITDQNFDLKINALALERKVEYYQWVENRKTEKKKLPNGNTEEITTYTYTRDWSNSPIDSSKFEDISYNMNEVLLNLENNKTWAQTVKFGAYKMGDSIKKLIGGATPLKIASADINISGVARALNISENYAQRYLPISGDRPATITPTKFVHVSGNTIYLGVNPLKASVGDVRVTFKQTPPAEVSVIALMSDGVLQPFVSSNGYEFRDLKMGNVTMDKMFGDAESSNSTMAWILRAVGLLLIYTGLKMAVDIIVVLANFIPFLGSIVDVALSIVAFLLAFAWSLIVIAVAWLRYRPMLAGGLIAGAVVLMLAAGYLGKKAAKENPEA